MASQSGGWAAVPPGAAVTRGPAANGRGDRGGAGQSLQRDLASFIYGVKWIF